MNKKCPICGEEMVLRPPGISKKTGKPYQAFMSCPNYKNHPPKVQTSMPSAGNGNAIILDELQKGFKDLNERIDAMGQWLSTHIK